MYVFFFFYLIYLKHKMQAKQNGMIGSHPRYH